MSEEKFTFKKLNEKIAASITANANDQAVEAIVSKRTQAEVTRRADILEAANDKYNINVAEMKKIREDQVTMVPVEGSDVPVRHAAYSEKQWKAKEALGKTIAEFEVAFLKIFGSKATTEEIAQGYQKLQELTKKGGNQQA